MPLRRAPRRRSALAPRSSRAGPGEPGPHSRRAVLLPGIREGSSRGPVCSRVGIGVGCARLAAPHGWFHQGRGAGMPAQRRSSEIGTSPGPWTTPRRRGAENPEGVGADSIGVLRGADAVFAPATASLFRGWGRRHCGPVPAEPTAYGVRRHVTPRRRVHEASGSEGPHPHRTDDHRGHPRHHRVSGHSRDSGPHGEDKGTGGCEPRQSGADRARHRVFGREPGREGQRITRSFTRTPPMPGTTHGASPQKGAARPRGS